MIAFQANHEEDVKQLSATQGVQALPAEKPELVAANAAGKPEMREKPKKVVNRKLVSREDFPQLAAQLSIFVYLLLYLRTKDVVSRELHCLSAVSSSSLIS